MEDDEPLLSIGKLARRSGLPVRTIRFWSDSGVVAPSGRTDSGRRVHDALRSDRQAPLGRPRRGPLGGPRRGLAPPASLG
jgi:hypothetical protein